MNQEDILDAVAQLDLSDEDLESLIQYFKDKKIEVISDEEDDQNLDDIDLSDEDLKNMDKDDDLTEVFEMMMIITKMPWNILIQILIQI